MKDSKHVKMKEKLGRLENYSHHKVLRKPETDDDKISQFCENASNHQLEITDSY